MAMTELSDHRHTSSDYADSVREFFEHQYRTHDRYWWRGGNRYSVNPKHHTPLNAEILRLAVTREPGRVLDVGAGEGADAIRLAKLGYQVDAIELSSAGCQKIASFADSEGVRVNIKNESILAADLDSGVYDVVLMNGSLHYISEKIDLLRKIRTASKPDSIHALSLFSATTQLSPEHSKIPVFPDSEGGLVEGFYSGDAKLYGCYSRGKQEESHPGFPGHVHSFIKFVALLSDERAST